MSKVSAKVLSPATKKNQQLYIHVHMHANSTHTIFVYTAHAHTPTHPRPRTHPREGIKPGTERNGTEPEVI